MGVCLSPSLSLPISLLPSTFAQTNRRHNSHFTRTFFLIFHFSVQVFVSSLSLSLSLSAYWLQPFPTFYARYLHFISLSLSLMYTTAHTLNVQHWWAAEEEGAGVVAETSVTRLGDFWKFLVTYFSTKVAQIFIDFLGYFEKHPF